MPRIIGTFENDGERTQRSWRKLFLAAGACILVSVVLVLVDFGLSFGGGDVEVGALSAVQWFEQLQSYWFVGLRNLGLFNVLNTILSFPLYLALFYLHQKTSPAGAAIAFILFLLGAVIYDANNQALTLLSLSNQYLAASSEAHKTLLAAVGTVILAQAEDFTPGTFLGLLVLNLASLWMMVVILRGGVFKQRIGWVGLVGSGCLLIFTVGVTFMPSLFSLTMIFAMVGGLLMLYWNVSLAASMIGRSRATADKQNQLISKTFSPSA